MHKIVSFLLLFMLAHEPLFAWGFLGHKTINKQAVFALPQPLFQFYKTHIEFISEHAVDPDQRRYSDSSEACRHYLDIERYETVMPLDTLSKFWKIALTQYPSDTLLAYGILPWHVQSMLYRLSEAFRNKNIDQILHLSADIGHYVADAHVPLHTSINYDGQSTHQQGIHALWETRIPQISLSKYNLIVPIAHYLPHPADTIWSIVEQSHEYLNCVLVTEQNLKTKWGESNKWELDGNSKGKTIKQVKKQYALTYEAQLNNMVEMRMFQSIHLVACFWYTAWILGGQPNLLATNKSVDTIIEPLDLLMIGRPEK